jgi:hypothetical protein
VINFIDEATVNALVQARREQLVGSCVRPSAPYHYEYHPRQQRQFSLRERFGTGLIRAGSRIAGIGSGQLYISPAGDPEQCCLI